MAARDAMTYINEMDEKTVQMFIGRLEFRGKDPTFIHYRDAYVAQMHLSPTAEVLEIGCGTSVVARAIAARLGVTGQVTGIDQSPAFIAAAQRLAVEAGVEQRTAFQVGDVHALDFPDARFDAAIAHTLISHVLEPLTVLQEAARVVRPGGMVAVFDGDYASWTFACADHALGKAMEEGIIAAVVNQPRVMRDMPRLLRQAGLERTDTLAYVYADIGKGTFFPGAMEGYAPLVAREGLVPAERVEAWLAEQRRAMEEGVFFARVTIMPTLPNGRPDAVSQEAHGFVRRYTRPADVRHPLSLNGWCERQAPNHGVQATASSVRCAPAALRA